MSSIEQAGLVETKGQLRPAREAAAVARPRARAPRRAPFSLRCGALLIDYTAVAAVVAFSTLLAR
ncbi:MAG: hypothetical protein LC774_16985, partial [Acidobacteria bacterium]|nr:hypothetical protein [Acidobacteriota bacterium]